MIPKDQTLIKANGSRKGPVFRHKNFFMTQHQITLIRTSWARLKKMNTALTGDVFYSKLFLEAPEVQQLFNSPRLEQANKLITTLSVLVAHLDTPDRLTNSIQQLAIRHAKYGVRPDHYELVGNILLWSLEHLLERDWNESLREAWYEWYRTIAETMIQSAYHTWQ